MKYYANVAIPMRVQPPHYGHIRLIRFFRTRTIGRVVIFICRDYGDIDNPFPFEIRRRWLLRFLQEEGIGNIFIPKRKNQPRSIEYANHFDGEFVVVVTHETETIYKEEGFQTINHQTKGFWPPEDRFYIPLHSGGRILRELLRSQQDTTHFIPPWLREEALKIINNL